MPLIDDTGRRIKPPPKKKAPKKKTPKRKPYEKPTKPTGRVRSWKSILLNGRTIRASTTSYHSGGRGVAGRGG